MYHKAGSLGDDDDASVCVHREYFMVESTIDVSQDVKGMLELKVDINVISIIGPGQGTEAKIVKRVLSRSPAGFTWKANPKHARDLIAWAGREQSKAAVHHHRVQLQRQRQRETHWMSCPGNKPKQCHRPEAQRPTSRWIGRTLPTASLKQIKTLQSRKCEPKRDWGELFGISIAAKIITDLTRCSLIVFELI